MPTKKKKLYCLKLFNLYLRPFLFLIIGDEDSTSPKSIFSRIFDPAAITIRCASKCCNKVKVRANDKKREEIQDCKSKDNAMC